MNGVPSLTAGLQRSASFAAMFVGWLAGYAYYALYEVHFSGLGYVEDFGYLVWGSLILTAVAWGVFVAPVLPKLGQEGIIVRLGFFPFAAAVYAAIAFTILIGWMFMIDGNLLYHGQAVVIGFTSGSAYLLLVRTPLRRFLNSRPRLTVPIMYALPLAGFVVFYGVVPRFIPSLAYVYYGGSVKEQLVEETLGSLRMGDSVQELSERLPGLVPEEFLDGGSSTISGSTTRFSYTVVVDSGRVASVSLQPKEGLDQ